MENEPSPLATLRQLKEWLDAGAITPAEFEVLKRKLLFSELSDPPAAAPPSPVAPAPAPPPSSPPAPAAAVPVPPTVVPAPVPLPPPPASWEFKHDPTIPARPEENPGRPPIASPPPVGPAPAATIPPVAPVPPPVPPRAQSQVPPKKPAPPIDTFTQPVEMVKVGTSSYRDAESLTPPVEPRVPESPRPRPAAPPSAPRAKPSPLTTTLIVGGIIALLALIAYLVLDDRESERLTSLSQAIRGADTASVAPEVGPQAEQLNPPPAVDTDTARVTPALPTTPTPARADSIRTTPAPPPVVATPEPATREPAPQPEPAAQAPVTPSAPPEENNQTDSAAPASSAPTPAAPASNAKVGAIEARIRSALSAYYQDLKAPPFNASQHFAPTVERFYTMQNTTPDAISAELDKSHFPEFQEGETQGVPGSLTISEPVRDGSRVVTFLEKSKAFRKSRQQYQSTLAQVRIRFDRNYKIVYLRQERLLENTFSQ